MPANDTHQVPTEADIPKLTYFQLVEHLRLSNVNPGRYDAVLPAMTQELEARSPERNYKCMKCGHLHFDTHELRVSSGGLSSIFGVEPARYRALVCQRCKFSELYHGSASAAQMVLDLFIGS